MRPGSQDAQEEEQLVWPRGERPGPRSAATSPHPARAEFCVCCPPRFAAAAVRRVGRMTLCPFLASDRCGSANPARLVAAAESGGGGPGVDARRVDDSRQVQSL